MGRLNKGIKKSERERRRLPQERAEFNGEHPNMPDYRRLGAIESSSLSCEKGERENQKKHNETGDDRKAPCQHCNGTLFKKRGSPSRKFTNQPPESKKDSEKRRSEVVRRNHPRTVRGIGNSDR